MKLGETKLGKVLVGPDGKTLYGFTNDVDAKSTCSGACALAWPPAVVDASWAAGPGLDTAVFATTTRDDGSLQLVAGKWPLYYFEGDATPGDTNGQGSGDVWFAVAPDAKLVKEGAATTPGYGRDSRAGQGGDGGRGSPSVRLADSSLGKIVADADGPDPLRLHQGRGRHAHLHRRLRHRLAGGPGTQAARRRRRDRRLQAHRRGPARRGT